MLIRQIHPYQYYTCILYDLTVSLKLQMINKNKERSSPTAILGNAPTNSSTTTPPHAKVTQITNAYS